MEAITDSGAKCVSFNEAEEQVEKLSGLFVSSTTIRALTYARGAELAHRQDQEAVAAMEPPTLDEPDPRSAAPAPKRVTVSQDGTKIRTCENWREVKISTSSVVEVKPAESPDEPPRVTQQEHSYRAGIWTSEELRRQHWADVQARGFDRAEKIIALGDGSVWIWENFAHCFPGCVEVLDWVHAKDRVWEAADAVFGASNTEAKAWVSEQLEWLAKGKAMTIRQGIRVLDPPGDEAKDVLRRVGQYFEDHAHRMQYQAFRQAGYPIGSGTVESAAKNVVESRMKRGGQRWAVPNANALLALRAELLSTAPPQTA